MENNELPTRMEFCTMCDEETNHTLEVDQNGETVSTCVECGHFTKYPAEDTAPTPQEEKLGEREDLVHGVSDDEGNIEE